MPTEILTAIITATTAIVTLILTSLVNFFQHRAAANDRQKEFLLDKKFDAYSNISEVIETSSSEFAQNVISPDANKGFEFIKALNMIFKVVSKNSVIMGRDVYLSIYEIYSEGVQLFRNIEGGEDITADNAINAFGTITGSIMSILHNDLHDIKDKKTGGTKAAPVS